MYKRLLFSGAVLTIVLFTCHNLCAQHNFKIKTHGSSEPIYNYEYEKQQHMAAHNRSLEPDGLSKRFYSGFDKNQAFVLDGHASDEEKKLILLKHYSQEASNQFDELFSGWGLMVFSLTLLATFILKKRTRIIVPLILGVCMFSYLAAAYIGGNFEDFKLYIEQSVAKSLLIMAAIGLGNYLFLLFVEKVDKTQIAQKIIILIGIAVGTLMLTSYLANFTQQLDTEFFNFENNKMNWTSCIFIILLSLFVAFQKETDAKALVINR